MVLGMRLNGGRDPLCNHDLEERVALYHRMYPDRPVVMPCACCRESQRNGYHDDPLWKSISFNKSKATVSHEVWNSFSVEDNDQWMSQYGLPFRFVDSTFRRMVYLEAKDY